MNRVCPKCNKALTNHELFFCSSCGYKLDESLISYIPDFKINKIVFVSSDIPLKKVHLPEIPPRVIGLGVLILLLIAGLVFSIYTGLQKVKRDTARKNQLAALNNTKVIEYPNTIDYDLQLKKSSFSQNEIYKYVPFEVDFFIEGNDLAKSIELINSPVNVINIVKSFSSDIYGQYGVFGRYDKEKDYWNLALVFPVNTTIDFENRIKNIETNNLEISKVDNYVVITNFKNFVTEMVDSSKGFAKNISHNPKYATLKAPLKSDGQIRFTYLRSDNFAEAFVLAKRLAPNGSLSKLLDKLNELKYNRFVIK